MNKTGKVIFVLGIIFAILNTLVVVVGAFNGDFMIFNAIAAIAGLGACWYHLEAEIR